MNNQEFIYWLNGFVDAVGEEGPTPKQWETIVSELDKVGEPVLFPVGPITRNSTTPYDPPFKVTCDSENPYKSGKTDVNITYGNTSWANLPKNTTINYTIDSSKELLND
jgi:hypothetical protein